MLGSKLCLKGRDEVLFFTASRSVNAKYNSITVFINFRNKLVTNVGTGSPEKGAFSIRRPHDGCRLSMMEFMPAGGGEPAVTGRLQR